MADIVISESKLEDMIFNHLSGEKYSENINSFFGYSKSSIVYRQLDLGSYGVADIVCFDVEPPFGSVVVEIYELKKCTINKDSLIQVLKYKAAIEKYFYDSGLDIESISLYLIGAKISTDNHFEFMPSAMDELYIYTYDISPDTGLTFNSENNWQFTDIKTPKKFNDLFVCLSYMSADDKCEYYHYEKMRSL